MYWVYLNVYNFDFLINIPGFFYKPNSSAAGIPHAEAGCFRACSAEPFHWPRNLSALTCQVLGHSIHFDPLTPRKIIDERVTFHRKCEHQLPQILVVSNIFILFHILKSNAKGFWLILATSWETQQAIGIAPSRSNTLWSNALHLGNDSNATTEWRAVLSLAFPSMTTPWRDAPWRDFTA